MTDNATDRADAIRLKRLELIALEREAENAGIPTGSLQELPTGMTRETATTTPPSAPDTSGEESHENAAGTAASSGNANGITTTTPIESTATTTKNMLKDERYTNLEAVVHRISAD